MFTTFIVTASEPTQAIPSTDPRHSTRREAPPIDSESIKQIIMCFDN